MRSNLMPPSEQAAKLVVVSAFEAPPGAEAKPATRFPMFLADELEIGDDPIWMVDDLLPAAGLGMVIGPPKNHKSFALADCLFHVAMGRSWAGRNVLQGAVVYITGEGVEGFKRRVIAMNRHYGVEGQRVPFILLPKAPDFGHNSGDDAALIVEVRAYLEALGNPPLRAIAIDTLARTMNGADENTAKDMSTFADNCGRLGEAFGCLVVGVHHTGKNAERGARGSNALDGAVDVMWQVEKGEDISTATILHMKDGEDGLSWQFKLDQVTLKEATATRAPVTTLVVDIVSEPAQAKQAQQHRNKKLGKSQALLWSIIQEAMSEAGGTIKGYATVPHDARAMSRENLKRYLPLKGYWDDDKPSAANRATFSRDLKELKLAGLIGLTADHLWLLEG